MHTRAAVATFAIAVHTTYFRNKGAVGGLAHSFRSLSPRIVAARANIQHLAHYPYWERGSLNMDKTKSHFGGPEKLPMAFLRNSYADDASCRT
jgi:hypothetical protein